MYIMFAQPVTFAYKIKEFSKQYFNCLEKYKQYFNCLEKYKKLIYEFFE